MLPLVGGGSGPSGWWALVKGSVRPVAVVVLGVLAQDVGEVAGSGDKDPVEAFTAAGCRSSVRRSRSLSASAGASG
jgi:hypothetical protein